MTKEDELDAEIAKLFDVENAPRGKAKKRLITDEETIAQMDREEDARRMEEACGLFLTREREFQRIAQHPSLDNSRFC